MLQRLSNILAIPKGHPQGIVYILFGLVTILAIWGAIITEEWALAALPAALLVAWIAIVDFHFIFFLMLACIPISIEMELPGGFGTDLPSEPLMWLLTLIGLAWFLKHSKEINKAFLLHPISLLLLLHLCWIMVSTVSSENFVISFKFLLAKGWYVIVFYFLAARVLQSDKNIRKFTWWFTLSTALTVISILARHAPHGFSFEEVNYVMGPFYRNHVMYACLLAVLMPFLWFASYRYKKWSFPWLVLAGCIVLFVLGINFAYTRAAYVALVAAIGFYWLLRWRLVKWALAGAVLVLGLLIALITTRDNWLEFAPDYNKAVTHRSFDNLLEATTKLQDISTMERVYRWVAASYMIQDKPLHGFGPGNFYFNYKKYTVSSFKTYVSDNPERSGIHNYYLMTTVEQGLPGLIFFLALCFSVLLYGERIYHRCREDWQRHTTAAATCTFALIALLMLMNDFVETDKIGSLFFISMAILVNMDLLSKKSSTSTDNAH
jgi:O-antigen ligase